MQARIKKITLFLLLTTFVLNTCLFAEATYDKQIDSIKSKISETVERLKYPGLAVAIYKDDFFWAEGFGFANLEHKVPATKETAYRLASVTKPMTAIAILQLAEKGKLDLDDLVQKYVPTFPEKKWPVTIRQLLGHLGGISHYKEEPELHIKSHYDTEKSLSIFKDFPLVAEPGTKYNYTSYGYNLLGAVIEGASEISYGKYLKENIWGPTGMLNTHMDVAADIIPNRASGYQVDGTRLINCEFVDMSSRFASGGVLSSVEDMVTLCKALDEGELLNSYSQVQMYKNMKLKEGLLSEYAMGWKVEFKSGTWMVSHGGSQMGTSTILVRSPGDQFALAIFCNQYRASLILMVQHIVKEMLEIDMFSYPNRKHPEHYHTWNLGLGHFQRIGSAITDDSNELKISFEYLNSIDSSGEKKDQLIKDGLHPIAGEAFAKAGSYIAQKLADEHGKEKLDEYRRTKISAFFKDYIELYKIDDSIPAECHLSPEMEVELIK